MLKSIGRAARDQVRSLTRVVQGRTPAPVPLTSMTLDADDVEIARRWLSERSGWADESIVRAFESEFAKWNGSRYAFAFAAGRVALSACVDALGLSAGDEVILPGYTCVVVPNALRFAGVAPEYADIELDTFGLDADCARRKLTPNTRGILLHHLFGLVCRDFRQLLELAEAHDIPVIEDCAHATGASFGGRKVGNYGEVGFYSSERSKIFNTIQGGIVVTNNASIAQRIADFQARAPMQEAYVTERQLYNVLLEYYQCKGAQRLWSSSVAELSLGHKRIRTTTAEEERGVKPADYGCRMAPPIAALAMNQLGKVDRYNARRREIAARWASWCAASGYSPPLVLSDSVPVFLRYPVLVEPEKKQDPAWAEKELDVKLGVWFVSHVHPTNRQVHGCSKAAEAVARNVNLPCLDG